MIVEPFVHPNGTIDPNLVVETQTIEFDGLKTAAREVADAIIEASGITISGYRRFAKLYQQGWERVHAPSDSEIIGRHPRWADRNGGLSKDFDNAEP